MKKNFGKLLITIILIVVVFVVIFMKNKNKKEDSEFVFEKSQDTTKILDPIQDSTKISDLVKETATGSSNLPSKKEQTTVKFDKDVLALVNTSKITEDYLKNRYESLPEQYKSVYKNDMVQFLNQLIIREMLYQEAVKIGFEKDLNNVKDKEQRRDMAIEKLIKDITGKIEILEEDIKKFYNDRISEMGGASYEQVKSNIKNYLFQQEQTEVINNFIEILKKEAEIVKDEEWIKEQQALKPQNPLDEALKSGKPTVLDLGASSCVPCKMMKPIFAELEQEYKGKANILLLEIYEYKALANKYKVMVIPTQIFFDRDGSQFWRHEGFLSKNEIIEKLKEMGAE